MLVPRASISPSLDDSSASTPASSDRSATRNAMKCFVGLGSTAAPFLAAAFERKEVIVDTVRQFVFAHEGQGLGRAGAVENGSNVRVAVETAACFGDVVGDDHVEIFFAQLLCSISRQILGLSGKPDQHLAIFIFAELLNDIRVWFQT